MKLIKVKYVVRKSDADQNFPYGKISLGFAFEDENGNPSSDLIEKFSKDVYAAVKGFKFAGVSPKLSLGGYTGENGIRWWAKDKAEFAVFIDRSGWKCYFWKFDAGKSKKLFYKKYDYHYNTMKPEKMALLIKANMQKCEALVTQ